MEQRLERLELIVTEQERTIEELSAIVTEHWHQIERLRKKLEGLTDRFAELEGNVSPDIPVTRPPHW